MKAAAIVPVPYLDYIKDFDFFMALAHLIPQSEEYVNFHRERLAEGKYVLLDNGSAEGARCSIQELVMFALTLGVNEIVLPDVIGDRSRSKQLLSESIDFLESSNSWAKDFRTSGIKVMVVPQAKDIGGWTDALFNDILLPGCLEYVDVIGVPKALTRVGGFAARGMAIENALKFLPEDKKCFHLLGCYSTISEVVYVGRGHGEVVRSVDSSLAYVCAARNRYISQGRDLAKEDHINFLAKDLQGQYSTERLKANIAKWRWITSDAVLAMPVQEVREDSADA